MNLSRLAEAYRRAPLKWPPEIEDWRDRLLRHDRKYAHYGRMLHRAYRKWLTDFRVDCAKEWALHHPEYFRDPR